MLTALSLSRVPVLLLGQFELAVQPQAQKLLLVQSIIQPLLQILHLTTESR